MALSDLLGISSTAGNQDLQNALAAIQSVQTPTQGQLTLPQLQAYVQAGVLTPQQYQAVISNPQIYQQITNATNQAGTTAQQSALQQLGGIAQTGSTPIMQAQLLNNLAQTNQAMQGQRGAIMEQAQTQGASGGGLEFINQLMNEQQNAQNLNLGAVNTSANNAQLALQALSQQGQLGGQLQGQQNQMSQAQAQAAQQVAEYNSQLQTAANQYNAQTANQAQATNLANAQNIANQNTQSKQYQQEYNAQLPSTMFNQSLQKAQGVAGVNEAQANLAQQQNQMNASLTGNLIGAGATAAAGVYAAPAKQALNQVAQPQQNNNYAPGPVNAQGQYNKGGEVCYAKGGEAHDHRLCMKLGGQVPGQDKVPGDSPKNDTVPAKLSPHEIVVPRTIAQDPQAPAKAAQFIAALKAKQAGGMPQQGQQPPMAARPPLPVRPQLAAPQGPQNFGDVVKALANQGLTLAIVPKGV